MKREAHRHSKVLKLERDLGIPRYAAVGILECLWALTEQEAPAGDVGKLSNEDIGLQVGWTGDHDHLVAVLVKCRLLDEHPEHRVVVHDWSDHAPDYVHARLGRAGLYFADGKMPNLNKLDTKYREQAASLYKAAKKPRRRPTAAGGTYRTVPNHTVPDPTVPNPEEQTLPAAPAVQVFEYWRRLMEHPKAVFDSKRRRAVEARLKDGYTVEQLQQAIEGCRASPWHRGENDRRKVFDDLELICRDAKHVDDFSREFEERRPRDEPENETPRQRAERKAREEAS
jgi:hypothetical protein